MEESDVSVLNTPIKKIRNLTLESPRPTSPVRCENLNDYALQHDQIDACMIEKGYSQTLSNAVLKELDTRAQEISSNVLIASSTARPKLKSAISTSRKRFSGIHRPLFTQMESISSHYAASRKEMTSRQEIMSRQEITTREDITTREEITSSATKKRRTLNGPEDRFFFSQNDPSPTRRKAHLSSSPLKIDEPFDNNLRQNALNVSNELYTRRISPVKLNVSHTLKSPSRQEVRMSTNLPPSKFSPSKFSPSKFSPSKFSPAKTPGISPSRGSMNLHRMISEEPQFAKPEGPVRIRQSSLQMAGVSESAIPTLSRKSSRKNLGDDVKSSKNTEGCDTNMTYRSLRNKTSTSSLNHKTSIQNLQKKPSVNNLQKKSSIPTLQKKPSIPVFSRTRAEADRSSSANNIHSSLNKNVQDPQQSGLLENQTNESNRTSFNSQSGIPMFSSSSFSSSSGTFSGSTGTTVGAVGTAGTAGTSTPNSHFFKKSNVTIPKPFSLYNKPTISSSQKSFGSQSSLHSAMSGASSSASERSSNRFQKFKNRFA